MSAKIALEMSMLQIYGNRLAESYSKHLDDGIFELQAKLGTDITRALYFLL